MDLPVYPKIKLEDIPELSIILKAGSNRWTKWFEKKYNDWEFDKVFTHTFLYLFNGDCANVGFTTTIDKIHDLVDRSHLYLSVSFKLTDEQTRQGISSGYSKAGANKNKFKFYDFMGYINFGLRAWIPKYKAKGSKRYDFCSDQAVDVFQEIRHPIFDRVDSETTSPCDLYKLLASSETPVIHELEF